ncbi:unnamed protein product [Calicophoron daubneyi]|uniref:Cysteine protease n=1 Tax=Calicophoron daubneyi TaxID=300641 RepID=A0AAV2TLL8_CALDB
MFSKSRGLGTSGPRTTTCYTDGEASNLKHGTTDTASGSLQGEFSASDHMRLAWNQVKFGWAVRIWPVFATNSIIVFLGRRYTPISKSGQSTSQDFATLGSRAQFAQDFASRLWFSYREKFPPLCINPDALIEHNHELLDGGNPLTDLTVLLSGADRNGAGFPHSSEAVSYTPLADSMKPVTLKRKAILSSLRTVLSTNAKALVRADLDIQESSHHSSVPLSVQTSDSGWGCMVRSGQMLLAQALVVHLLGRNWRLPSRTSLLSASETSLHRQIIRWFNDSWSSDSPFSIHRIVQTSKLPPGSWYSASVVCSAFVKLMIEAKQRFNQLSRLHIYLARDRVIYRKEILELSRGRSPEKRTDQIHFTEHTGHSMDHSTKPCDDLFSYSPEHSVTGSDKTDGDSVLECAVILLIPLMFGASKHINSVYIPTVCKLLEDPFCLGIIGGRPRHSIYVAGYQDTDVIYFDPHFVQAAVDVQAGDFDTSSWHCDVPKVMRAAGLDPSCAAGFYCRTRGELSDLLERMPQLLSIDNQGPASLKCLIDIID